MGTGCLLGRDPDIAEDGVRPVGEYFNSLLVDNRAVLSDCGAAVQGAACMAVRAWIGL